MRVDTRLCLWSGPPGLGGLLGMLGGGGGAGGGGGGGLAVALNSMMQSPQMQALATQLESANNGNARVPSSVAVEERHAEGIYGLLRFKLCSFRLPEAFLCLLLKARVLGQC